ncbi:MAG: CatB-related O-acetyltransferase [Anaerolineales bacterium]
MSRILTFKQILRAFVVRVGTYLDLIERRDDPRYQQAHVGANVLLGNVIFEGDNSVGDDVKIRGNVTLGFRSTLGHHCIVYGGDISIGRYCQFAPHVSIYAINHSVDYMTTYVNKRLFGGELQAHNVSSPIHIGHDVWIGHGSIVLKGVKIGDGAVVGAGSVVTRDVPDYGIVAGNPARLIRKRFEDEIIVLLKDLAWWNKTPEQIEMMKEIFFINFREDRDVGASLLKKYLAVTDKCKNETA